MGCPALSLSLSLSLFSRLCLATENWTRRGQVYAGQRSLIRTKNPPSSWRRNNNNNNNNKIKYWCRRLPFQMRRNGSGENSASRILKKKSGYPHSGDSSSTRSAALTCCTCQHRLLPWFSWLWRLNLLTWWPSGGRSGQRWNHCNPPGHYRTSIDHLIRSESMRCTERRGASRETRMGDGAGRWRNDDLFLGALNESVSVENCFCLHLAIPPGWMQTWIENGMIRR